MSQQHINYSSPNDGLGDTLRTSQVKAESNFNELYSLKVDKVTGKELSDVNFSQVDKDKLDLLDPNAGAQSDWNETDIDSPAYIDNKPANVSDFFNDAEYIADTAASGLFFREAGSWVAVETKVFDGVTGVTAGFAVAQFDYDLPDNSVVIGVYINGTKQYKTTANNGTLLNRYSITGNTLTLTKSPVLNNYIYIEYL